MDSDVDYSTMLIGTVQVPNQLVFIRETQGAPTTAQRQDYSKERLDTQESRDYMDKGNEVCQGKNEVIQIPKWEPNHVESNQIKFDPRSDLIHLLLLDISDGMQLG